MIKICCFMYITVLFFIESVVSNKPEDKIKRNQNTCSQEKCSFHKKPKNSSSTHLFSKQYQGDQQNDKIRNVSKIDDEYLVTNLFNAYLNGSGYRKYEKSSAFSTNEDQESFKWRSHDTLIDEDNRVTEKPAPEQSPFAVMIILSTNSATEEKTLICSGTLVAPRWVLTAATCFFKDTVNIGVYAGGNALSEIVLGREPSYTQTIVVKNVYLHPRYKKNDKFMFDLALVLLKEEFKMTSTVNTATMVKYPWTPDKYRSCLLTGFGKLFHTDREPGDNSRKTVYIAVKTGCECTAGTDVDTVVSCGKEDDDIGICPGDVGSGLICDGIFVALTTTIFLRNSSTGATCTNVETIDECGKYFTTTIFQQIYPYLDWIDYEMKRLKNSGPSCFSSSWVVAVMSFMSIIY